MKKFNAKTLTIQQLQLLIRDANPEVHNQIRIDKQGFIYISEIVGNCERENVKFAFETFCANNGYVGITAANDLEYIKETYRWIQETLRTGFVTR